MKNIEKPTRIAAIVLVGLTAAMNLLGGVGTTCAAFSSNVGYRLAFKELMDYRWIYQILVVTTILIGIAGFCFGNIMLLAFPEYFGIDESFAEFSKFFSMN